MLPLSLKSRLSTRSSRRTCWRRRETVGVGQKMSALVSTRLFAGILFVAFSVWINSIKVIEKTTEHSLGSFSHHHWYTRACHARADGQSWHE